jgi:hypothetical protein
MRTLVTGVRGSAKGLRELFANLSPDFAVRPLVGQLPAVPSVNEALPQSNTQERSHRVVLAFRPGDCLRNSLG